MGQMKVNFKNKITNNIENTYSSTVMKSLSSDIKRKTIKRMLQIEITAPVDVGCVKSFGILR